MGIGICDHAARRETERAADGGAGAGTVGRRRIPPGTGTSSGERKESEAAGVFPPARMYAGKRPKDRRNRNGTVERQPQAENFMGV